MADKAFSVILKASATFGDSGASQGHFNPDAYAATQIEMEVYTASISLSLIEVCTFGALSDETVGIFIGASLPGVDVEDRVDTYSDN